MRIAISPHRQKRQRGNNIMEFALLSIFLIPLFMGTATTGIGLGKAIQTTTICRDAGAMFVRQVDFSQAANQNLLVRLTQGMNMTATGGNGVIILTQILLVSDAACDAASLTGTACANRGYPVIIQRVSVGNQSIFSSEIGNPSSTLLAADGTIVPDDYLVDTSVRANTVSHHTYTGQLTMQSGEKSFISEAYFRAPELSFLNQGNTVAMYSRNYF